LQHHQFITTQYFTNNPNARGLLILWDMGYGKTLASIKIAEVLRQLDPSRKIIVLVAKSLQENFKENIEKYMEYETERIKERPIKKKKDLKEIEEDLKDINDFRRKIGEEYEFVSLNASNMFAQLSDVGKTPEEKLFEKKLEEFASIASREEFLENSLLIIDEAHNIFNAICNGSKNAIDLYDTIMKTQDIKLVFLTGTPIINNPFELVPCFNMISGALQTLDRKTTTLLPEVKEDFENYFVDYKTFSIRNKSKFENRIVGLSSYYGKIYELQEENFPEQYFLRIEIVDMSSEQYEEYNLMRSLEKKERIFPQRREAQRFSTKGVFPSSYRIKSRQVSNFLIPKYAIEMKDKKIVAKNIHLIRREDLLDLDKYSPKFKRLLENLDCYPNTLGTIYSEFVSDTLAVLARVLEEHMGYVSWEYKRQVMDELDIAGGDICKDKEKKEMMLIEAKQRGKGIMQKVYAVVTGETSIEKRIEIVKEFNSEENKYGERISLLLFSRAGAEGLDLRNVRHVHILEPFWNYARIDQVISRAVRFQSHTTLPPEERNVQPYLYLADYPSDISEEKREEEETTDVELYQKSVDDKILIDSFLNALIESSIDCSVHHNKLKKEEMEKIKCKLCAPTDQKLFDPDISRDMLIHDPCLPPAEEHITVKEIILDKLGEKKFYYSQSPDSEKVTVYEYSPQLDGYSPMRIDNPLYAVIVRKILKL
jgi:superfamily II DNA or RNA helicase